MPVSRETEEAVRAYVSTLKDWNERISLVGPGQLSGIEERAIADAEFLAAVMGGQHPLSWADLGSGGGLPAIPLALVRRALSENVVLVDSDRRKSAFLRHVARKVGLSASIVADRIEVIPQLGVNVLTAQALASMTVLAGYGHRHLADGGRFLALKGKNVGLELEAMRDSWTADVEVHRNGGETVVVEMSNIRPRNPGGRNGT
jgi:16S rRNA (guanine527-N7)-methyltransferase